VRARVVLLGSGPPFHGIASQFLLHCFYLSNLWTHSLPAMSVGWCVLDSYLSVYSIWAVAGGVSSHAFLRLFLGTEDSFG
jgi:hypothetical protein